MRWTSVGLALLYLKLVTISMVIRAEHLQTMTHYKCASAALACSSTTVDAAAAPHGIASCSHDHVSTCWCSLNR